MLATKKYGSNGKHNENRIVWYVGMGKNYLTQTDGTSKYLYLCGLNLLYLESDSLL